MPRRKTTINQEEKLTVATNYPIDDPRRYGEAVENNQLSVFDYSSLDANTAKLAKESAIEIKAREKAIWENIIEIGNRLIEVKTALPRGKFDSWVESEFKWSRRTAYKYIKVAEELEGKVQDSARFYEGFEPLYALASGLSKADEETKEEILTAVEEKTEEKGKALTEKEIKDITAPYLKQIEELKKEVKNLEIDLESNLNHFEEVEILLNTKIEKFAQEKKELSFTLENQHKQIQELNSAISAKESALATIETKSKDLTQREKELEILIKKKANVIAEQTIESEKAKLRKKEEELKQEQEKIKKELAEVKRLKSDTEKEKIKLSRLDRWIEDLTDFNSQTDDSAHRLLFIVRNLQDLPDLEVLQASDKEIVSKRIYSEMQRFYAITETYGAALNNVAFALRKLDNTVLKAVNVEVIN